MHIVLIDPSRVVQHKLASELEATGCYVDSFSESDIALAYVAGTPTVDVILTSLELAPITGLELCWKLRTLADDNRPLHIIVMSSNTSERALAEALDCGADDFVAKPIRREELMARLRAANRMITLQRQLVEQAETDHLTGALNRRAFLSTMGRKRRELDAAESLSVCLMDIDGFGSINETFGHETGDTVIATVARIAGEEAPIVARLAGKEFALAFPVLDPGEAARWCEAIRAAVASHGFRAGDETFYASCSFGVSDWSVDEPLDTAMKRASRALIAAQRNGRERIQIAAPAEPAEA